MDLRKVDGLSRDAERLGEEPSLAHERETAVEGDV
jgi:hypothetical protein